MGWYRVHEKSYDFRLAMILNMHAPHMGMHNLYIDPFMTPQSKYGKLFYLQL